MKTWTERLNESISMKAQLNDIKEITNMLTPGSSNGEYGTIFGGTFKCNDTNKQKEIERDLKKLNIGIGYSADDLRSEYETELDGENQLLVYFIPVDEETAYCYTYGSDGAYAIK